MIDAVNGGFVKTKLSFAKRLSSFMFPFHNGFHTSYIFFTKWLAITNILTKERILFTENTHVASIVSCNQHLSVVVEVDGVYIGKSIIFGMVAKGTLNSCQSCPRIEHCLRTVAAIDFILHVTKMPIRSLTDNLFSEPAHTKMGSTGLHDIWFTLNTHN